MSTAKTVAARASAPAKIILFGEHFVVYGSPAILASIDRRISVLARMSKDVGAGAGGTATFVSDIASGRYSLPAGAFEPLSKSSPDAKAALDPLFAAVRRVLAARAQQRLLQETALRVEITSEIPSGVGLGSSAASCVATIAAVDSLFSARTDRRLVCEQAIESERIIHGNSSGADCYVSTYGGLVQYSKNKDLGRIELGASSNNNDNNSKNTLTFVVGSTGIRHSTGELVGMVGKLREKDERSFAELARQASRICKEALAALRKGDRSRIGLLMNQNQELLRQIGVSHRKADEIIELCLGAGALGAKVTGAGGGGAVIALARSREDGLAIASCIGGAGYAAFLARIDHRGLVVSRRAG